MANVKITELDAAAALDGTEEVPIVQDGDTVRATLSDVASLGGTPDPLLVGSTILSATATSFTFSGIPAGYHDLLIVGGLRTDRAAQYVDDVLLRVGNGGIDSGANYRWGLGVIRGDAVAEGKEGEGATSAQIGETVATSADAGAFSYIQARILNYASTTLRRGVVVTGGINGDPTGVAAASRQAYGTAEWTNTTQAITNVQILPGTGPNFIAGSWVRVYAVGVDPS